ncbi:hypothetical protein J2W91_001439 [Paenibacillus amylolyticus]|uniref:Uncharacterized protein n=1 Tax=Paenibacillus amylolyticus TaxID=1451 RepID=A0AAP5GZF7_PAEAM|nr:hypothetical protein [Paenibacillus amylolyticus]MDR6722987.1 hypothetical protein [Paenibacillus amylolyticus]
MKILRSILLMSLCCVLSLSMVSITYGAPEGSSESDVDQEQEEIISLFSQLGELNVIDALPESNRIYENQSSSLSARLGQVQNGQSPSREELESRLSELGVEPVSQEEINRQFGDNDTIRPNVALPPSTNSVKWYSKSSTLSRNGKSYVVQMLFAQGLNQNSNLYSAVNNAVLYSGQNITLRNLKYIGSMYAQKAIGLIPVVSWTPYEILFGDVNQASNNDYLVTHRASTTMIYSYVRESTQPASDFRNTYVSNMISVASAHTLAYYDNNENRPKTKSEDFTNTTYDENFGNTNKAVDSFLNGNKGFSNITQFKFYNHDKTKSLTYSVTTPSTIIQVR